ncbi:hypothetical protein G9A89_019855 [Geosiphon pyriformis]|nr:hypothetical protein G9A89_019855 [Geosiphon pyriformis]
MAKIPQNKAQKRLENVVDKIMTKIKLAIKEQQIVGLHQELTKETWTWWMQQFSKNYCYFHLRQHINIQNLYTNKTKQLFDTTILKQLEQFETALIYTYEEYRTRKIINHQAEQAIDKTTVLGNY